MISSNCIVFNANGAIIDFFLLLFQPQFPSIEHILSVGHFQGIEHKFDM